MRTRNRHSLGPLGSIVTGSVMTLAGLVALVFLVILPLRRQSASEQWTAVPCTIVESRIGRSSNRKGTYDARVGYRYVVDGVERTSDRITFADLNTSDPDDAREIVARYPAGATSTCYVNPAAPEEVVLERSVPALWLGGLFAGAFTLFGALLSLRGLRGRLLGRG